MKIAGFKFSKISIEQKKDSLNRSENLKADTSVDVSDIEEVKDIPLKTKEQVLDVKFKYNVDYSPGFAEVNIEGTVLIRLDPKTAKKVLKKWKDNELEEDFKMFVFNVIIRKSTLKALYLEEELGLPTHVPLPSVRKKSN